MRTVILLTVSFLIPCLCVCNPAALIADDGVTLDSVVAPGPNQADEPVAKELSLEKAAHFLDSAALTWQKEIGRAHV